MCGVFGAQFNTAATMLQRAVTVTALAHANNSRGTHSWGIFGTRDVAEPWEIEKAKGSIREAPTAQWARFHTVAGHTRWATQGKPSRKNAHPFDIGNTIGMHNGTISNHHDLNEKYRRTFAVDSMHLVAHVDEGRDLTEISSYGTLVFAKKDEPGQIFLGNWNGGELAIYRTDIGVLWASEYDAVETAMAALGISGRPVLTHEKRLYAIHDGEVWERDNNFFTCVPRALRRWDESRTRSTATVPPTVETSTQATPTPSPSEGSAAEVTDAPNLDTSHDADNWGILPSLSEEDRILCGQAGADMGLDIDSIRRVLNPDFNPYNMEDPFYFDADNNFLEELYDVCMTEVLGEVHIPEDGDPFVEGPPGIFDDDRFDGDEHAAFRNAIARDPE